MYTCVSGGLDACVHIIFHIIYKMVQCKLSREPKVNATGDRSVGGTKGTPSSIVSILAFT